MSTLGGDLSLPSVVKLWLIARPHERQWCLIAICSRDFMTDLQPCFKLGDY
jgi:hypothetical protein